MMLLRSVLVFCLVVSIGADEKNDAGSPRLVQDSYLAALANSRISNAKSDKRVVYVTASNANNTQQASKVSTPIRREDSNYETGPYAEPNTYNQFTSQDSTGNYYMNDNSHDQTDSYLPQQNYGPPKKYLPPSNHYGTPHQTYGPPMQSYGPPNPIYGPPKPVYGVPYEAPSFLDKIDFKLDLLTFAKILLKLIIFKKIVKFIAIVCMLFFIPKLIHIKKKGNKKDNEEDEERTVSVASNDGKISDRINILAAFFRQAMETYSIQEKGCENMGCRFKRVLDDVDDVYTFSSMAEMFEPRNDNAS